MRVFFKTTAFCSEKSRCPAKLSVFSFRSTQPLKCGNQKGRNGVASGLTSFFKTTLTAFFAVFTATYSVCKAM